MNLHLDIKKVRDYILNLDLPKGKINGFSITSIAGLLEIHHSSHLWMEPSLTGAWVEIGYIKSLLSVFILSESISISTF